MFPFQQNNEFPSQIFPDPHQENQILSSGDALDPNDYTNLLMQDELPNTNNDVRLSCNNKIVRKEIERQRRQQMSTLHASLRSLLPLESLKGKRSKSDHISEAARYIKDLQNNVQELSVKRDELKNLSTSTSSENKLMNGTVTVRSHLGGVAIIVSCGSGEENFLLSRVLQAVVEEGFDIHSCISAKRDQILYYAIQCQATHITCIGLAALQQKLNDVILSL